VRQRGNEQNEPGARCSSFDVMEKPTEEPEINSLSQKESIYFPDDLDCVKLLIEWVSKQQGIICDLDLNLYCYDERVCLPSF
jgi:hypothetical protein